MRPNNHTLKAGLAAFGLLWTSANRAGAQEAAIPPVPAPLPSQAPTNEPTFAVLLLSNGQIIQGSISPDKAGENFLLHQKGGQIRFPKSRVEKKFGSMSELYQYKLSRIARADPEERMKLVRWCLENHMKVEAEEHLQALIVMNPGDVQAQRMLTNLKASTERAASIDRDAAVRTTGVEMADVVPRELNPGAIPRPRGEMARVVGRPVIFDLPPDVAVKRAGEFTQYVHPVLQIACASCHNEAHTGEFKLIRPRSRRETTPEIVRTNLDATLRFVNRDDPMQSEILAYASNPHGTSTQAVLRGPNDVRYGYLATWLGRLKPTDRPAKTAPAPASLPAPTSAASPSAERFGSERQATRAGSAAMEASGIGPLPMMTIDSYEGGFATAPGVPPNVKFEVPSLPGSKGLRPAAPKPATLPVPPVTAPSLPSPAKPGAAGLPELPPESQAPPPDDVIPPTNRPKKTTKFDPSLLEKVLKTRQAQP